MKYHPELRTGLSNSALNQGYRVGRNSQDKNAELSPQFKETLCKPLMGSLGTVYDSVRNVTLRSDLPPLLR